MKSAYKKTVDTVANLASVQNKKANSFPIPITPEKKFHKILNVIRKDKFVHVS